MASRARAASGKEAPQAPVLALESPSTPALEARVEALEEQLDRLHSTVHRMFADLEVRVVDGYLVKAWPDAETGEWVAECPKVGAAVQEPSRDEAFGALAVMIAEVLLVKQQSGDPLPQEADSIAP
jgi:hypothetical protein